MCSGEKSFELQIKHGKLLIEKQFTRKQYFLTEYKYVKLIKNYSICLANTNEISITNDFF